jgi:hypothetical protein
MAHAAGDTASEHDNRKRYRQAAFFFGTFAPFFRASERPIAIACLRLFTLPPLPPLPERKVPFFFRRIALATVLPAAFPYFRELFLLGINFSRCLELDLGCEVVLKSAGLSLDEQREYPVLFVFAHALAPAHQSPGIVHGSARDSSRRNLPARGRITCRDHQCG